MNNEHDFIAEYDDIYDNLKRLLNEVSDKGLKKDIELFIRTLQDDFQEKRNDCEEILSEEASAEEEEFVYADYNDRL